MGLFNGCLLACDIDGTLLINGYINPRNIEKIEFFVKEGGYFSLSTGRTLNAVSCVLDQIKNISPSVVANGCMIYDYENQKVLREKCLPKSDYLIAKKVLDMGLDVGVEAHSGSDILVIKRNKQTDDHEKYENLSPKFVSFEEACDYNWNKSIYLFNNLDDLQKVKDMIAKENTDSYFVDTSATLYGEKRNYYEQVPKGVSKATALDELLKILNIKKGCFFAAGDYYNDLEMIKKADIGAAPQESPDDIKAHADFIAGPCVDGAVADFIDYLTKLRKDGNNGRCS